MDAPLFTNLLDKFSKAESLPELPSAAMRLTQMIDDGTASNAELERVILGDPGLTAGILRASSSAAFGMAKPVSTIKQALLVLGSKTLRAVATSLWIQAMLAESKAKSQFDTEAFARHSIFVGFLSRYLFSSIQRTRRVKSAWEPDELFAAGVLHDLAVGLLAITEPKLFDRTLMEARMRGISFAESFSRIAGGPLVELGAQAARTWKFPPAITEVIAWHHQPTGHDEAIPLACVHYANWLAETNDVGLFDTDEGDCSEWVREQVGLSEDDLPDLIDLVLQHTRTYVAAA